jgi:hypothetical protein
MASRIPQSNKIKYEKPFSTKPSTNNLVMKKVMVTLEEAMKAQKGAEV